MFWGFVWRITCDGKTAPGCGCTPAVSGGDGGFHQQNHVGAGGWGLVCGIVVLLWPVIKRNSLHNA
ncbi:hypothetical protein EC32608_1558 [Escherichia coli 3.2608]|uniref:Uncharacterized protein n=1 Tax=Escherichia coli 4.0967 TaxID=869687 RepID=A0AAN4AEL5_ECOLX|nr:hypothetical protein EC32608_1558 [Escherichia coli 3.2608]EIH66795.1 hypothetical protein EC930624_1339 [Escherichia coli 93.0624]EII34197.1 hypothetical protein EC40967_4805 [Escherichia coli 4.0967]